MRDQHSIPASEILLDWYDAHARDLPWRVLPLSNERADPYHVWLSEVMLQQTTVVAVKPYFESFLTRWPEISDLAAANDADVMAAWAGLGYYARARNLLKCARVVSNEMAGVFPTTEAELLKLPGIGPYTAAAIAAIAFDRPATVLDGNVERVIARVNAVTDPLPASKEILRELAAKRTPETRPGDYAQAVMDLGATICTPRNPACGICPWWEGCEGRISGIADTLPRKIAKKLKPTRYGHVYLARRADGAMLLEERPAKGLLGGMLGWPGSPWAEDLPPEAPPIEANWRKLDAQVRHSFTHFHLYLSIYVDDLDMGAKPLHGQFIDDFRADSLPTVMRKAWDIAKGEFNV